MTSDHIAADLRASCALADQANDNTRREAWRKSLILAALENIIKHDDEPCLRAACRARYLDLTDGRLPR